MLTPRISWLYASHSAVAALALLVATARFAPAQRKLVPPGGNIAIVADERLAALRRAPAFSARLIRRLSRGRFVSVRTTRRNPDGILFSHVVVTRRTAGWIQSEALIMSGRNGDDQRLAHLIGGTDEFERVARARIFLDAFPRSRLRPTVLLALGLPPTRVQSLSVQEMFVLCQQFGFEVDITVGEPGNWNEGEIGFSAELDLAA